jgi:hypothetical protein
MAGNDDAGFGPYADPRPSPTSDDVILGRRWQIAPLWRFALR